MGQRLIVPPVAEPPVFVMPWTGRAAGVVVVGVGLGVGVGLAVGVEVCGVREAVGVLSRASARGVGGAQSDGSAIPMVHLGLPVLHRWTSALLGPPRA
jgi:hypothetical protein